MFMLELVNHGSAETGQLAHLFEAQHLNSRSLRRWILRDDVAHVWMTMIGCELLRIQFPSRALQQVAEFSVDWYANIAWLNRKVRRSIALIDSAGMIWSQSVPLIRA
jgi:hypothetical protein